MLYVKKSATLNEVLSMLGFSTTSCDVVGRKMVIDSDGVEIGTMTASQCWEYLLNFQLIKRLDFPMTHEQASFSMSQESCVSVKQCRDYIETFLLASRIEQDVYNDLLSKIIYCRDNPDFFDSEFEDAYYQDQEDLF